MSDQPRFVFRAEIIFPSKDRIFCGGNSVPRLGTGTLSVEDDYDMTIAPSKQKYKLHVWIVSCSV